MSTARLKEKLVRFAQLDGSDKLMLIRAVVWLAAARLMLIFMPFRRLAARLSLSSNTAELEPDQDLLQRIGFAIGAAANNVPWR